TGTSANRSVSERFLLFKNKLKILSLPVWSAAVSVRRSSGLPTLLLGEQAPGMQKVAVLAPALADVGAVKHVRNDDRLHAVVGVAASVFHRRSLAGNDQRIAVVPGDFPIALFQLHVA